MYVHIYIYVRHSINMCVPEKDGDTVLVGTFGGKHTATQKNSWRVSIE